MEISENVLKIQGTIEITPGIAEVLKYQRDYQLLVTGSIVTIQEYDKQDGSMKKKYTLKIQDAEFNNI